MNKTAIVVLVVLCLAIIPLSVTAIDNSYAFTIELNKYGDQIIANMVELHITSVSDLADQEIKQESDYVYKIVGTTVFEQEYYQEYVLLDGRNFMNTKFDCFKIINEEEFLKEKFNPEPLDPNNPLQAEPVEQEPPRTKTKVTYDATCGGMNSIVESEDVFSYVNVPYVNTIDNIVVYDKSENVVAELDLSSYANYCGDYVCSATESHLTCSNDCQEEPIPLLAKQIFRTENSEITADKDMQTYVAENKCLDTIDSCAEVVGTDIYVKATDNTQILINNNNQYTVSVDRISDNSEVQIHEEGVASVTNKPFRVKGDWSQISDVKGSFEKEDGSFCNYDFDSTVTAPVTIQC